MRRDKKENQNAYINALVAHHGISRLALQDIGITRQTLHRWEQSEAFIERVEAVTDTLEDKYLSLLQRLAEGGNVTAVIFALKSIRPEKYDDQLRRAKVEAAKTEEVDPPLTVILQPEPPPERVIAVWAAEKEAATREGREPDYGPAFADLCRDPGDGKSASRLV